MKMSYSIDINSTPETVFSWLERPEKAMAWMNSVSKTEMLHETPDMVGSIFRETVGAEGNGMELKGVVTGYQPNKLISFHLESRVNIVDVEYRIEETHTGVRLTQNGNVLWKFPVNILSLLMGSKLRQDIMAQSREEFKKLKELCEGGD
jgi:uncharacterized protein YndB with AHSA1/START domain